MKIIKRIYQLLMRSPYTLPICALVSIISVVYTSYTLKEMVFFQDYQIYDWIQESTKQEPGEYISEQPEHEQEETEQETPTVFSSSATVDLPEAEPEQQIPTEQKTEQETELIKPQKPSQSTTQGTTSKPQKPSGSTSGSTSGTTSAPVQKPISGWSVTYAQAKSMVRADSAYDYEDLYWLSRIISAEAKGESFTGQIGVGTVVLNRVRSREFPNTVKGVVFDKKYGTQFTPVANGSIYQAPTQSAIVAAKMCLDGYTLSNSVLYFLNPSISSSSWIQNNRKYAFRIGNHDFYY